MCTSVAIFLYPLLLHISSFIKLIHTAATASIYHCLLYHIGIGAVAPLPYHNSASDEPTWTCLTICEYVAIHPPSLTTQEMKMTRFISPRRVLIGHSTRALLNSFHIKRGRNCRCLFQACLETLEKFCCCLFYSNSDSGRFQWTCSFLHFALFESCWMTTPQLLSCCSCSAHVLIWSVYIPHYTEYGHRQWCMISRGWRNRFCLKNDEIPCI